MKIPFENRTQCCAFYLVYQKQPWFGPASSENAFIFHKHMQLSLKTKSYLTFGGKK
jgi:hypothetical protein